MNLCEERGIIHVDDEEEPIEFREDIVSEPVEAVFG